MCYYDINETVKGMKNMDEKEKLLNEMNREETLKIKLAETLKETTRMVGEFRINSNIFEDKKLKEILEKGAKDLKNFNRELSSYISTLS